MATPLSLFVATPLSLSVDQRLVESIRVHLWIILPRNYPFPLLSTVGGVDPCAFMDYLWSLFMHYLTRFKNVKLKSGKQETYIFITPIINYL